MSWYGEKRERQKDYAGVGKCLGIVKTLDILMKSEYDIIVLEDNENGVMAKNKRG